MGLATVLMGFALPEDRIYAPKDNFHLLNFYNGIVTSIWFPQELATNPARHRTVHKATMSRVASA